MERCVFIDIEELGPDPLQIRHEYPAQALAFDHPDASLTAPVRTEFTLIHKDRELLIRGTVGTEFRYKCSRCLKECSKPLFARFDLGYIPNPEDTKPEEEISLKYAEMEIGYYDGIRFDVDLMVLEQIELLLPMRFVCREDCRGLCPSCGADLNERACGCTEQPADSRMAALLEFKKNPEK
jgi:uncharacterized protein